MSTEHPTAETVAICALLRDMERKCTEVNLCNIASIIESQAAKIAELEQALVRTEAHWRQELEVYKSTGEPKASQWYPIDNAPGGVTVLLANFDKNGHFYWAQAGRRGDGALRGLWYTPSGSSIPSPTHWASLMTSLAVETSAPHVCRFEKGYCYCGKVDWPTPSIEPANTKPAETLCEGCAAEGATSCTCLTVNTGAGQS